MAWSPPADTEIEVDKPIKAADIRRIRDLAGSIAVGDSGAPILGSTFLETVVISNDTTVEFSAGFDDTRYGSYLFVLNNVLPATNLAHLYIRTSNDGGSTYDSTNGDYSWSVVENGSLSSDPVDPFMSAARSNLNTAGLGVSGNVTLFDPGSANQTRLSGLLSNGTSPPVSSVFAGLREAGEVVDGIQFYFSTGNLTSGEISMFGIGK